MSEKLDLVRSIYADWERGDWSRPLTWADPEIELVAADGPDASSVTGVAAMAMTWTEFLSTWDDFRAEAHEYREIDDEHILVYVHNTGRGKGSGMEVGQVMGTEDGANLFVIRDGKVVKLVLYWDRNRALADLGLEA
jgi:ketosteroid isomerase-like protein